MLQLKTIKMNFIVCWIVICLSQIVSLDKSSEFYYPPKKYNELIPAINPLAVFPCLVKNCDNEYGCFKPLFYRFYLLVLPPISACPEVQRKGLIRFFAITREKPHLFQSVDAIPPKSSVGFLIHGIEEEYNEVNLIVLALSLLKNYQVAVAVDVSYTSSPYLVENIHIPLQPLGLQTANAILNGRVTCKLIYTLYKNDQIDINAVKVVGFSSGSWSLYHLSAFCKKKYGLFFPHFVGLDTPSSVFRYSNYRVTGPRDAKFVDIVFTSNSLYLFGLELARVYSEVTAGALESGGTCTYIVNPDVIDVEQPACPPGLFACSHLEALIVFAAVESGKCLYRYFPCAAEFGTSPPDVGLTRFNCKENKKLFRTCVKTSAFPLQSC